MHQPDAPDDQKTPWPALLSNSRGAVLSPRCIDSFVSTYDKWMFLTKSMRKTIKVDQNNIAASDEFGDMSEENEEELQSLQRFRPQPRVL